MPQIKIKNKLLLAIAEEINFLQGATNTRDFLLLICLRSKLNNLKSDNGVRITTLLEKIEKLRQAHFVFEDIEGENKVKTRRMKMFTKEPIAAAPAKFETKVIKKGFLSKDITEEVMISPEVHAQTFAPVPVCQEGKTMEDFDKAYNALLDEDNDLIF